MNLWIYMMQSNKKTKNASDALKIISLSLDPKMGEEGSAVRERVRGYAENVDRFDTIYPSAVDIYEGFKNLPKSVPPDEKKGIYRNYGAGYTFFGFHCFCAFQEFWCGTGSPGSRN